MTKKTLVALADYLRDSCGHCEPFTERQIEHLANFCNPQNPRFKRERWLAYVRGECGPNGGSVKQPRKSKAVAA